MRNTLLVLVLLGLPALAHADRSAVDDLPASLRKGPGGGALAESEVKDLLDHKTLVKLIEAKDGEGRGAVGIALIDAPADKIFKVLRDYDHYSEFMPYIANATVDSHVGNHWVVTYTIKPPIIANHTYQMDVMDEKETVEGAHLLVGTFKYTGKGDIKDTHGTWKLVPVNGGASTFVRYEAHTDLGGSYPNWMMNKMAVSGPQKALDAVRKRVASR